MRCPRCGATLEQASPFCPQCGTQLSAQPLEGEVVEGAPRPERSPPNPVAAAALSIIPGLGHLYAGAPLRGILFFAGVVGPVVVGTDFDLTGIGALIGVPLDVGGLGLWALSAVDAFRTARQRAADL
jgi:hypothetical protein